MPLKIKRRVGQRIEIGQATITITNITNGTVEMIIDAPRHVQITRDEAKCKLPRTTSCALSHTMMTDVIGQRGNGRNNNNQP